MATAKLIQPTPPEPDVELRKNGPRAACDEVWRALRDAGVRGPAFGIAPITLPDSWPE